MDSTTNELYIAKLIATNFQKLRRLGGFHVYDNLRLLMKNNKYSDIVKKHMEYIVKTTRVQVELVDQISMYSFYKNMEINEVLCDMYLIRI